MKWMKTVAFWVPVLVLLAAPPTVSAKPLSQKEAGGFHERVTVLLKQGKYARALDAAEEWAVAAEKSEGANPAAVTASALGSVSWAALLAGRPERALEASERALRIKPGTLWIEMNHAHALLFLGRTGDAIAIYREGKGKKLPNESKWEMAVRKDFAGFRERGLAGPQLEQAEKALASQETSPGTLQQTALQPAQPRGEERLTARVQMQIGHAASINSVTFSPDGKLALSGSDDKTMKLWDVATGRELRSFGGHLGGVNSVAFSPDGKFALSGSCAENDPKLPICEKGMLRLWETATGRELRSFQGHGSQVNSLAFSPDGKFAISGSWSDAPRLWELATGGELRSFRGGRQNVKSLAFSPDGAFVLSGGGLKDRSNLSLWEVATGSELRSFKGHTRAVTSVAFSPNGKFALSGSEDKTMKLWDVATGQEIRSFRGHSDEVYSVAFSPDGQFALSSGGDKTLKLWNVATGQELRTFTGLTEAADSVAFSPDGRSVLSDAGQWLKLRDAATGRELRSFARRVLDVDAVALSHDGRFALSANCDYSIKCEDASFNLWDVTSGRRLRSFEDRHGLVLALDVSPDGQLALSGGCERREGKDNTCVEGAVKLWEMATGRELRSFKGHKDNVNSISFSPDGRSVLSASCSRLDGSENSNCVESLLKLWDVATGQELRTIAIHCGLNAAVFSPDGKFALSTCYTAERYDETLSLWELSSGRELRSFKGHSDFMVINAVAFSADGRFILSGGGLQGLAELILWDTATGQKLRSFKGHKAQITAVAFSPDGKYALSGGEDKILELWDVATGQELRTFEGHEGDIKSVRFFDDGRRILSAAKDGTIRLWDAWSGRELALMSQDASGWVTMTPEGFFSGSRRDTDTLAIVRGVEATAVGQVHQSLFNPDLVREALAGDPDGEVKRAAGVVTLEKVLDAGPVPAAVIVPQPSNRSGKDLVTVSARITDRGKGIGRIEWRLNGVTAGVASVPAGLGPDYEIRERLALDPGENRIEVIAYEARNLLASRPARTSIVYDGPADTVKPKLHILAIGINAYEDKGWAAPGSDEVKAFPPLGLAVGDAKAFAAEMEKAAAGLYGEVRVRTAIDREATPANLDRIVREMAAEISPRDTFVLFAAAHGYSLNGNYYMIPQDYQGGANPEALKTSAIGQDRLQDWIANRIKAKKALILLDTCKSGALTGGYTKSRTDAPASEAAVGRLHEATGRPVLTAAASGKPAFEGYKGHGVFTYALMEALHKGDTNGNGKIELTELAAHVQKRVPELVAELGESGGVVKGAAVIAMRRGGEDGRQSAQFGSTGEDFAVVARLP